MAGGALKELAGKTAVVTGAASGLGRAMALAFAREGMQVALADVDENGLSEVSREIQAGKAESIALKIDVTNFKDLESLRENTLRRFGGVHLVCNNAGVSVSAAGWEATEKDWQWVLGVNLWGVIHGVRAFAPLLIAQDEGRIVNTASVAGLISPPGSAVYNASKHAVVALSETLHHDLRERNSKVGVSVLCPAYVPTGIADSARNRPEELRDPPGEKSDLQKTREQMLRKAVRSGRLSAGDIARAVVAAVKEDRFYVLTHPKIKGAIRARMEDILEDRAPRDPLKL